MPKPLLQSGERVLREERALELRAKRLSYEQIAKQLGSSISLVHGDVMRARQRHLAACRETLVDIIDDETRSLDAGEARLWAIFIDQGIELDERLKVYDRILRTKERRAKLLGLDRPEKAEISGSVIVGLVTLSKAQIDSMTDAALLKLLSAGDDDVIETNAELQSVNEIDAVHGADEGDGGSRAPPEGEGSGSLPGT